MCNLPQPFTRNLDALERNFAVSTFLFNNYFEPMFKNIYTDPADDPPRPPKSRKQRLVVDVLESCNNQISLVHATILMM